MASTESSTYIPHRLHPFIGADSIISRSPGRINLIGEHTDYNEGFVLPAAIDQSAYISLTPRQDNLIRLRAVDLDEQYETTVECIERTQISWPNYILGVVSQYKKRGIPLRGFDASLVAEVPIGAGLSSSAAVECSMAMVLNEFLQTGLDKFTLVKMAQKAEHEFAGVQCGIMDQFASIFGKKDHAMRLDCRSLEFEYIPLLLKGIKIVLFDTNVKHSLASSEYNTRRSQCEEGVAEIQKIHPEIQSLRDVTPSMVDSILGSGNPLVFQRCKYVVEENRRLLEACLDLQKGDLHSFGKKMFATHMGLSKLYEVSCPELDFLVESVQNNPFVLGARMMGGGFGGCSINLVKEEGIEELTSQITNAYQQFTHTSLKTYIAEVADGASILNNKAFHGH